MDEPPLKSIRKSLKSVFSHEIDAVVAENCVFDHTSNTKRQREKIHAAVTTAKNNDVPNGLPNGLNELNNSNNMLIFVKCCSLNKLEQYYPSYALVIAPR